MSFRYLFKQDHFKPGGVGFVMMLEEEVPGLLRLGLLLFLIPAGCLSAYLTMKYKQSGFGWVTVHLLLLAICAFSGVQLLDTRAAASSEYNSLAFAGMGILWAISMICLVVGLTKLKDMVRLGFLWLQTETK